MDLTAAWVSCLLTFLATAGTTIIGASKMLSELKKQIALAEERQKVSDEKVAELTKHIKEHNGYAKTFTENMPLIKDKLNRIEKQVERIEDDLYETKKTIKN